MAIDSLLSHVKGLRKAGPAAWMCLCPAHQDRSRSLKITQADDGRVLIHCFAGCDPLDILGVCGLTMDDLFDKPLYHRAKPIKGTGIYPRDVLTALKEEFMIVVLSSFALRKGKSLSEVDQARLELAYERFTNAVDLAGLE